MGEYREVSVPITPRQSEEPKTPQRPEHIPEKFWNAQEGRADVDAMAKSYSELQQAFTQVNQQKPPANKQEPAPKAKDPLSIDAPKETPKTPQGQVFTNEQLGKWTQEFEQNGSLSEDTYNEIPYPRPLVDSWIAGQQALLEVQRQSVFNLTGGAENYQAMAEWGRDNLTAEERDAFNTAIVGGKGQREAAINGLWARYKQNEGSPPARKISGNAGASGSAPFKSKEQWKEAMRDPRYKKDPAYVEEVARRLSISNI